MNMQACITRSPDPLPSSASDLMEVETRFGRHAVPRETCITMPSGVLGFETYREYAVVKLPDPRLERFRLLQSLKDKDLAFIVCPLDLSHASVCQEEVQEMARVAECDPKDLLVFLIVTVRKSEDNVRMTVNRRAPLIIDTDRMIGRQHVLSTGNHDIQMPA